MKRKEREVVSAKASEKWDVLSRTSWQSSESRDPETLREKNEWALVLSITL